MIVVDTNVMVCLLVGGEGEAEAILLHGRDPEWATPTILVSELRNVLLGFVRQGIMDSDEAKSVADDALNVLEDRIFNVESADVIDTALECSLTAYDAEFVALARQSGVWLATRDSAILRGAPDVAMAV